MAGNLESVLAKIPFYAGYQAKRQADEAQTLSELQQASGVQGLLASMQKQQQEKAFRTDLSALAEQHGGHENVPQGALATLAAKYASPHDVLATQQKSLDRQAQTEANAAIRADATAARSAESAANREARRQELEMRLEDSRTANRDRMNIQLELARMRADAQKEAASARNTAAEDKSVEGQINKTSQRMKDIMPVYTAARQLNEVLDRFTPDNAPGLGYAKNTDIGKAFLSDEGKDVSSSQKLLGNSILKAMSGAAVTPSEEVRQMAAMMSDGRYSAHDFYLAWPKIANWVNDQVALGTSGLTDQSRPVFEQRTGIKTDRISPRFAAEYSKDGKVTLKDTRTSGKAAPSAVDSLLEKYK